MNETTKKEEHQITLSTAELDKLFGHADGNAALLYLYIRRTGGFSVGRAARDLKCTEAELSAAAATLRSIGLLEQAPERRVDAIPEYTAEDVTRFAAADPEFEAVVSEAEFALGRVINSGDLKLLFGIYDYWGLSVEVIMELLHHCVERYQAQYGPGRTPTMRSIEKEAQFWAQHEITTLEAVEEHIRKEKEKRALVGQVKEILQIRQDRELSKTEAQFVDDWLTMGFGPEAIAIAYDRTMVSAGRLAWKYMDKIIKSWNEKKLYTPEEIEAGDSRNLPPRPNAPQEAQRTDNEKLENMRRMYARMQSGKQ